jgi:hypothetical protein
MTSDLDLSAPHRLIEATRRKVVDHDRAIQVPRDTVITFPDEEARDAEANEEATHGKYRLQFLSGVSLLVQPCLLDLGSTLNPT